MSKRKHLSLIHDVTFKSVTENNLTFEHVFDRITRFITADPRGIYQLIIGTDSHVFRGYTKFITGVMIVREGKGAWACRRRVILPREIRNLKEKISLETAYTEEIASFLTYEKRSQLEDIILPYVYQGASIGFVGHADVGSGKRNATREYVSETIARIESMGMEAKIKPYSFVASSYANRYTK